jgi:hypothetical protein
MFVQNFMLLLLAVSIVVSGLFIAVGWPQRASIRRRGLHHTGGAAEVPGAGAQSGFTASSFAADPSLSDQSFSGTRFAGDDLDVTAELHDVLARLEPLAAQHLVQIDLAVQPDLAVHLDPQACRQALTDVVSAAIAGAPGGRVLLAASRAGSSVNVVASDDGAAVDHTRREAALRPASELLALHGGRLDIKAHKGEGTTVILRLPAAAQARPSRQPAIPAAAPHRQSHPLSLS